MEDETTNNQDTSTPKNGGAGGLKFSIPANFNDLDRLQAVSYLRDDLKWQLTPLYPKSKVPVLSGQAYFNVEYNDLLKYVNDGCNIGVLPFGNMVMLDLDSKHDDGKSVEHFLSTEDFKDMPRERTPGGCHIPIFISDIKRLLYPGELLHCDRVAKGVTGELFLGGCNHVMTSPSTGEDGQKYFWEKSGVIPELTLKVFTALFGEFLPKKSEKKKDIKIQARAWEGDLKSLNIVAMLEELGWYHGADAKLANGHVIICPWSENHSDGKVTVTIFSSDGSQWAGFNCFHDHCCDKGIIDVLKAAEEQIHGIVDKHCTAKWKYEGSGSKSSDGRPQIVLPGLGRIKADFVKDVSGALQDKEVWFSQNNSAVMRVSTEPQFRTNDAGEEVEACERLHVEAIGSVEAQSLLDLEVATGVLVTVKLPDGNEAQEFVTKSIGEDDARMLIKSPILIESLPKIDRVLDLPIPILRGGEWHLPKQGYNKELRVLVDQDFKLREMPLDDAIKILEDIIVDFPFADDDKGQSKTHWYARLITPMCRGIMGWSAKTPMWVFLANRPRAGKDYLNGVCQI